MKTITAKEKINLKVYLSLDRTIDVVGEKIETPYLDCVVVKMTTSVYMNSEPFESKPYWNVHEVSTGKPICNHHKTRQLAIEKAIEQINRMGEKNCQKAVGMFPVLNK